MIKYLIFSLIISYSSSFAQDKSKRILPNQSKYNTLMDETGNPLEGKPVLIVNYFPRKKVATILLE